MKLLVLISATLSAVSAARQPEEYICYTTAAWGAKPCNFPFVYKGKTYDKCTSDHSGNGKAWCGTTYDVRDSSDFGDCDFQRNRGCGPDPEIKNRYCCLPGGECHAEGESWSTGQCSSCTCVNGRQFCTGSCEGRSRGYCDTTQDCYSFGNDCDPNEPPIVGGTGKCICKNNVCKISSGCGTEVQNWFSKCSDCNAEDCGDEGVCSFRRGRCIGPEDYPPSPSPRPCVTKYTRQQCHFPFDYKGQTYYKCIYEDRDGYGAPSQEPWCGLVPLVGYDTRGAILDNSEVEDCFMAPGSTCRA